MSRYILQSHETGVAVNGNPWLRITLLDRMGPIKAMLFNYTSLPQEIQQGILQGIGKVLEVVGEIEQFNNENQIKIKTITMSENQDVIDLLPSIDHDYQQLQAFTKVLIKNISDEKIRTIVEKVIYREDIWAEFITKVAGKVNHHATVGGLMAHSVGVATSALQLANFYTDINKSLVVAGALLHDIGKCKIYTDFQDGLDYNDEGRMFDHIVTGITLLIECTRDLEPEYQDRIKQIEHIIASHHGQLAYGSPVEPSTVEAKIVSICDGLDAFMDVAHQTIKKAEEPGFTRPATKMIRRDLYVETPGTNQPYYRIPGGK